MRQNTLFRSQTLLIFIVFVLTLSCNRSMNHPSPTPPTGGIAINLTYPESNPAYGKQIELIINEPGGAILMDSMIAVNTPVVTTLHTTQKLVDITTVVNDSSAGQIYVTTWAAVDPTGWTTAYPNGYNILDHNTSGSTAKLYYTNLPVPLFSDINFADGANGGWASLVPSSGGSSPYGSLTVNYSRYAGNYAYILFPIQKLYNFHIPAGDADTVELTQMDTAIRVNYYRPDYAFTACNLVGDMDTNNIDRALLLYAPTFGPGFDSTLVQNFCYPPSLVEKYELRIYAHTPDKKSYISYYSYGPQVPQTMPFPDSTSYTLNSTQPDNFSVTFLTVRPTYANTVWVTSNVNWTVFASPDSTQLHPLSMLSSLNSRMLRQQNLSSLSFSSFGYGTADQLNYQDYFSFICNLPRASTSRPGSEVDFSWFEIPYPD